MIRRGTARWIVGTAGLLTSVGCAGPEKREPAVGTEIDPVRVQTRDDIYQIVSFWPLVPWLTPRGQVSGFKVTTYFRSGETDVGAFVPGMIRVVVDRLDIAEDGAREWVPVFYQEWSETEAMGFRVTRRSMMGYPYTFFVRWPDELRLEGKRIRISFEYDRLDGKTVRSSPKEFRVPLFGEAATSTTRSAAP